MLDPEETDLLSRAARIVLSINMPLKEQMARVEL
jgi:hypothetical protein